MKKILMTLLVVVLLILVVPNVANRIDRWYWEKYTSKTISEQAKAFVKEMDYMDNEMATEKITSEAKTHYSSRRDRLYFIVCCTVMYGIKYAPEEPMIVVPELEEEGAYEYTDPEPQVEENPSVGV